MTQRQGQADEIGGETPTSRPAWPPMSGPSATPTGPARTRAMRDAGADVVLDSMAELPQATQPFNALSRD